VTAPTGETSQPTEVSYCYRHPKREAMVRCVRCDRPICPDCMRPASVGFQCPDDVRSGVRSIRTQRTSVGARLTDSRPFVTIGLVVLNVAVYAVTALQPGGSLNDPTGSTLFRDWSLLPYDIHQNGAYWQLLTSAFLHLNLLHIALNMISLVIIGPPLEALLGRWRFGTVYVVCALGSSAADYCFGNPLGAVAGASGAIFGLFGIALMMVRRLGLDLQWLAGIIVFNFIFTFSVSNISKLGHVGGFVTGLLCALALAGLPRHRRRLPLQVQLLGLGGIVVLVIVLVGARSASPLAPAWLS
jgi:membrane associated rhomboid family serine protease